LFSGFPVAVEVVVEVCELVTAGIAVAIVGVTTLAVASIVITTSIVILPSIVVLPRVPIASIGVTVAIVRVTLTGTSVIVATSIVVLPRVAVTIVRITLSIAGVIVMASSITVAVIRVTLTVASIIVATSIVVLPRVTIAGTGISVSSIIVTPSIAVVIVLPSVPIVIGTLIITLALSQVGVRGVSYLLAKLRMVLQVSLQLGMVLHILFVIYQLRIFPKLFGNFAVAIKKLIESHSLVARALILPVVITGFLVHESVRIFLQLLANVRMLLHESLQRGMIFHEFVVVDERRILPNLFGNLAVAVEELVKQREFLAGNVSVLR
jgi:hypothetical protein